LISNGRSSPSLRGRPWICLALAVAACGAHAQIHITESLAVRETYTNNVELSASGAKQSDLVSEITPAVSVDYRSPRSSLQGSVSVPIVLYAKTTEHSQVYVSGSLAGTLEAIDKFLFIDASASASQQYLTPFGATPVGLVNATNNRYTSITYRISPYIKGVTGGNIEYLLRYTSVWGNLSGAPIGVDSSRYTDTTGDLTSPVAPWGWAAHYQRLASYFTNQDAQIMQLARGRLLYQATAALRVSLSGGYENNQFPFTDYSDVIYGVQAEWRPSERTQLLAGWEHRFFGPSYLFVFDHRTPQTVWNVNFSRNITTYTQQLGAFPAGGNVSKLLNDVLTTRIPDPAQRQAAVNQLIASQGLPQVLDAPVNLYTQQVLLQQGGGASAGFLGVNNTIFLAAFYVRTEPISGSGNALPPILEGGNNNTQRGVTLTWSHPISATMSFTAQAGIDKNSANVGPPLTTTAGHVTAGFNWILSPLTSVQFGARYQRQHGVEEQRDYSEAAVFAGFLHRFQ
jgi:uncharacterized protein (PEP-CTERM system associated)